MRKKKNWEYAELVWNQKNDLLWWSEPPWIIQHKKGSRKEYWYEIWYQIGNDGWELITTVKNEHIIYYHFKRDPIDSDENPTNYIEHPLQKRLL